MRHSAASGCVALKILKNHSRVIDVLRSPLRLRKNQPVQRSLRRTFRSVCAQKRLRVADESDFAGRQAQLLPKANASAGRICARLAASPWPLAARIRPTLLRRSRLRRNRARHLIGEGLDHQRMRRDRRRRDELRLRDVRARASPIACPSASRCSKIEIERSREHEDLVRAAASQLRSAQRHRSEVSRISGAKPRIGSHAAKPSALRVAAPAGCEQSVARMNAGRQCSFPPMRPCFTMVASTSTMARTATSAVMSEMS